MEPPQLQVTDELERVRARAAKFWRAQAPYFSEWPTQLTGGMLFLNPNFSTQAYKGYYILQNFVVFIFRALLGSFLLSS